MKFKFKLRQEYKTIRQKIPDAYRHEAALKAAALFVTHPLFKMSQHIACYLPFKDEFDSLPLIESIWRHKKKCYLPVVSKKEDKILHFVCYKYGDPLHRNQYSILEPINISQEISPQELDVVITPLIAFDLEGHRLGTGGGYYDKTFAFILPQKNVKPTLLGLGYAAQQALDIPHDPWDVRVAGIITEVKILNF